MALFRRRRTAAPQLWNGADVVWTGPTLRSGGVEVRAGDRAAVVDAGRFHLTSSSPLSAWRRDGAPRRMPAGVLLEVGDGRYLDVPPDRLRLVAPDLPLGPEPDAAVAAWFPAGLAPRPLGGAAPTVAALVPGGFAELAVVRHAGEAGELGEEGRLDVATAAGLVEVLGPRTTTPDDVVVAVWAGWADVPAQRFPGAGRLRTPHREHLLLRGPLEGVLTGVGIDGRDVPVSGLWWPADRAWVVVTEVDLAWTYVAGAAGLVDALAAHPHLDVGRTAPEAPLTAGEETGGRDL